MACNGNPLGAASEGGSLTRDLMFRMGSRAKMGKCGILGVLTLKKECSACGWGLGTVLPYPGSWTPHNTQHPALGLCWV